MDRISQLLIKRLSTPLTPQEQQELSEWAGDSSANRQLFDRLTAPSDLKHSLDLWRMVDSSRACADMQRQVNAIIWRLRLRRVSVAAAVIIVLVAGLLLLTRPSAGEGDGSPMLAAVTDTVTVADIKPGVTRALLSDASGRTVLLSASDTVTSASEFITGGNRAAEELRDLCLNVPRGGEFKIQLEDGTEVWLNSDTRLYYPPSFSDNMRHVRVDGEAYFAVATDSLRPFCVETAGQIIRVYGTSFNVRNYPEEHNVYTTLEHGAVSLSRIGGSSGELFLTPGHQAVFSTDDERVNVKPVDTEVVTSWRKGRFVFENQSLLRIMQDLGRWYDFDYEFADPALEQEEFMGSIPRYSDFTTAIAILEKCGGIRFTVTDGKVVISRQ